MLQLYYKSIYLVAGDKRFKLAHHSDYIRDDKLDDGEFLIQDATWSEMKQAVENGKLAHLMYVGETFWKKRPYISAAGYHLDVDVPKYFEDDETRFSVICVYVLDKHYTMNDVMKHARADQAVQWFKERGLAVCPMQ